MSHNVATYGGGIVIASHTPNGNGEAPGRVEVEGAAEIVNKTARDVVGFVS